MYRDKISTYDLEAFKQMIKEEIKNEILKEVWIDGDNYHDFRYNEKRDYQKSFSGGYQQMTFYPPVDAVITEQKARIFSNQIIESPDILSNNKWADSSIKEHRNEILYGVGTIAVLGMLMPHFRRKIGTVLGRTASEGMQILERTRSLIAKAKEDIEDLIAEVSFNDSAEK